MTQYTSSSTVSQGISSAFELLFHDDLNRNHSKRLQAYRKYWLYYLGKHWSYARDPGEPTITVNYVRALLDKHVDFTFKKGFSTTIPDNPATPENEQEDREFIRYMLEETWERNNKFLWAMEAGQQGGVTGDVFARVSWDRTDPLEDPYARVDIIPSHLCFPEFGGPIGVDRKKLRRLLIVIPVFRESVSTAVSGAFFSRKTKTQSALEMVIKSEEWTSPIIDKNGKVTTQARVTEYEDKEVIETRVNPLGEIPVVHIANYPLSGEFYGISDLVDVIELNREYNEKMTDVSDIINYHACVDEKTEALTRSGWKKPVVGDEILCLDPETDEISWQSVEVLNEYDHDGELVSWKNHIDALTTPNHRWLVERRSGRKPKYSREMVFTSDVVKMSRGSHIILGGGMPTQFPEERTHDDELVELVGWFVTEGALDPLPSGSVVSFIHQSMVANPLYVARIRQIAHYWRGLGHTFTEQTPRLNGVIGWYLGTDLTRLLLEVAPFKRLTPEFLLSLTQFQAELLLDTMMAADGTGTRTWYQDDTSRRDSFQMLCSMLGKRSRSYDNIRGNGVVDLYERTHTLVEHTLPTNEHYKGKVWCPTVRTGVWFARRNGSTYWTGNSPTTVVYGAKLKDLEKGANRMWGMPEGSKVENLVLSGDLQASNTHIDRLKETMLELTGTPEQAFGKAMSISNTPGVSLQMQYLPMVERRDLKILTYGLGLRLINRLLLKVTEIGDSGFSDKMKSVKGNKYRNKVVFPDPMPQDEIAELEKVRTRLDLAISTRRRELEKMGYSQAEVLSIIADVKKEQEEEMEMMFESPEFGEKRGKGVGSGNATLQRGGPPELRGQKIGKTVLEKPYKGKK